MTFLGLLRRETLSLPLCLPIRWQVSPSTGAWERLWITARAELKAFVGVMILMEADWARPWLPGVLASGAFLSGYGVAQSFWNPSDIAAVGRIPGVRRWRCGAVLARRHALESDCFRVDSCCKKFSVTALVVRSLVARSWLR